MLQKLEKEAMELAEMATTKQFLDPSQNPTKILIEMRRVSLTSVKGKSQTKKIMIHTY